MIEWSSSTPYALRMVIPGQVIDCVGGVASPLLANIYIHRLLRAWKKFDLESKLKARVINYADDLVVLCRGSAEPALQWLRWIVEGIGLGLNETKTCIRDARLESFDFLGYTFGPMVYWKTGEKYLGVTPSKRQRKRLKESLRKILRPANMAPTVEVVADVNRRLRGWANYFSVGTLYAPYKEIDYFTSDRLRRFLVRRHKVSGQGIRRFSNEFLHDEMGLICLNARRSSPSSHALT